MFFKNVYSLQNCSHALFLAVSQIMTHTYTNHLIIILFLSLRILFYVCGKKWFKCVRFSEVPSWEINFSELIRSTRSGKSPRVNSVALALIVQVRS